jgi:ferredoxin-type protein NapH
MLKATPYLGIIVLIISIGGIFYPKLGYFLMLVFATLIIIAPFRGRWFCGNLCPRGSFVDFWLGPISRKAKIPATMRTMWLRIPIFFALMGFMIFRIIQAQGVIDKVGMVFVTLCIMTTSASIIFGVFIAPKHGVHSVPWAHYKELWAAASASSKWIRRDASNAANAKKFVPCSFR